MSQLNDYLKITNGQYDLLIKFETMYDCRIPLAGDVFLPSDDCYCIDGQWFISRQSLEFIRQRGFACPNLPH